MRGLIAYDTYYGNGAQVAEAIADELRAAGHELRLVNLHETSPMCGPGGETTPSARRPDAHQAHKSAGAHLARKLDAKVWAGKPALVYDTYGPLDPDPVKNEGNPWMFPGGVAELRTMLTERGLAVAPDELRCLVSAMKGPLVDRGYDEARAAAPSPQASKRTRDLAARRPQGAGV